LSESSCDGSGVTGQSSIASQKPSLSVSGSTASVGQAALLPVQVSAMSHASTAERQTVELGLKASAGHAGPLPVQVSARSHTPAAERQTVLVDAKPSPGQLALDPVQFSATSQTPTELRHTAELGLKTFAGQLSVRPSQFSVKSQKPAAARHGVLDDAFASAGQLGLDPSQVSTRSQTPAEPRHTAPELPAGCVQVFSTPLHTSSVQTFESLVHGVLFGCFASLGQLTVDPSQFSVASHSPADERQTTNAPDTLSLGHG
jgi:hypothetical protein